MKKKFVSSWPYFSSEEIDIVQSILQSGKVNYWTGEHGKNFEVEFSHYIGTKYAVALSNGTIAIELALKALGIGPGDEVIVTPRTFIASVSSIVNVGAVPVYVDIDPNTQNIDPSSIPAKITKKTRAIICVHLAGWPCDMTPIIDIAQASNLYVIEDCAQAHGAKYKGQAVGSMGDIGCWSFCQDKIISTGGEGGMITTNNKDLWSQIWALKDHGKNFNKVQENKGSLLFNWVHDSIGSNYRMTEIQAAIGRLQLKKLDEWNRLRIRNANKIWETFKDFNYIRIPDYKCASCKNENRSCNNECVFAAYKCYVFVEEGLDKRNSLIKTLHQQGVKCSSGSCSEVYLEKAFEGLEGQKSILPNAKKLGETSLMFECHPTISEKEIEDISIRIKLALEKG